MYCRILSWSSHAVIVQKVQLRSGSSAPVRNPGARFTCFDERQVCNAKERRKRMERIRRRVKLMKLMFSHHKAFQKEPEEFPHGAVQALFTQLRRRKVPR